MNTEKVTRKIAGHEITLESGHNYMGSRPVASWARHNYPVTIYNDKFFPVLIIEPLTYDEANAFLAEFNNGKISFASRKW